MHLLVAVDTYPHKMKKFIDWLRARKYKDYPRDYAIAVREFKLLDLVFSENAEDRVLQDLKNFEGGKIRKLGKVIRLFRRFLPIKDVDRKMKVIKRQGLGIDQPGIYVYVIGKVENGRTEKGKEMI